MVKQKSHNEVGDVVLVRLGELPAGYARVEEIRHHSRPGWYECDLLFLSQPLQPVTWILEREQIDGSPFTMGGRPVRIEGLPAPGAVQTVATPGAPGAPPELSPKKPERDSVLKLVPRKTGE